MKTRLLLAGVLLGLSLPASARATQTLGVQRGCDACHAEIEFLRQHTTSLEAAQSLAVTRGDILASAHREQTCTDCHSGVSSYPHAQNVVTESCASCHEAADTAWHAGLHSVVNAGDTASASCESCHTTHDVADAADLLEGPEAMLLSARCSDCHETSHLPEGDPHADTISCAGCHEPHQTLNPDDAGAWVAPANQYATCGACHEDPSEAAVSDVHGLAIAELGAMGLASAELRADASPAYCTACHGGGHGMAAGDSQETVLARQEACVSCHTDYADRYYGTYHGKATALGSEVVASCADCHTAHDIHPDTVPASSVHATQLVATCGECHEASREAFVAYDSHPDPMDPSRNAPLFFSFVFMNALLLGVLAVFGLHTLLWWVRIIIDGRKEAGHA